MCQLCTLPKVQSSQLRFFCWIGCLKIIGWFNIQGLDVNSMLVHLAVNVQVPPHGGDVCSMQRDVESVHSGDYGRHMGIQCNVACASIEIQIICNLFWALEAICHWIFVAAHYCCLIKISGYSVEYWIFRTAQKGYLRRGLNRKPYAMYNHDETSHHLKPPLNHQLVQHLAVVPWHSIM